jgi:hypothetical protein
MPAVRFSRDKRGYEYVFLVHTATKRGKPGRTRVLYWYRTPPGLRLGRKPFDDEVRRTLERQNPGVSFDWDAIVSTPMPPPDMTEYWRERRRAEKAAKAERRAAEADEAADVDPDTDTEARTAAEAAVATVLHDQREAAVAHGDTTVHIVAEAPIEAVTTPDEPASAAGEDAAGAVRKRRRRRGGRRRRPADAGQAATGADLTDSGQIDAGVDEEEPADQVDPPSEEE